MAKYRGREKNRTMDEYHKIAKRIVKFAKERKMGIVMEGLKGIRNKISYGKMLNRRLHSWNFRKPLPIGRGSSLIPPAFHVLVDFTCSFLDHG